MVRPWRVQPERMREGNFLYDFSCLFHVLDKYPNHRHLKNIILDVCAPNKANQPRIISKFLFILVHYFKWPNLKHFEQFSFLIQALNCSKNYNLYSFEMIFLYLWICYWQRSKHKNGVVYSFKIVLTRRQNVLMVFAHHSLSIY